LNPVAPVGHSLAPVRHPIHPKGYPIAPVGFPFLPIGFPVAPIAKPSGLPNQVRLKNFYLPALLKKEGKQCSGSEKSTILL